MRQLTPSELRAPDPGARERLQAAAAEVRVASMEGPLKGGNGDSSALSADAPDPLEAAGAELEVERLRALLLVGTNGLAAQRGVTRERVRQAAQRARAQLQMVA